jgi:hypothetical protein
MFLLADPAIASKAGNQGLANVAPLASSLKRELPFFFPFL